MEKHFIGPGINWLPTGNRELIFGLGIGITGLFLGNVMIYGGFRLGFAIAAVLSLALTWGYLHRCGHKGNGYTRTVLGLCLVIAAGFGWSADTFVKGVMLLFLLTGANLAFCQMAGQNRFAAGSVWSLLDAPRGMFSFGVGKIGLACRGVAAAFRTGNALTQRSGAVLAGLAIALPLLAVVVPLLMFADAAFEGLMDLLPEFDLEEVFVTACFGGGFALFLYARAVGLSKAEPATAPARSRTGIQKLTVNTALGAVCAVYLTYLFSQIAYFAGGFLGILPEGYSTAEYARRGFFEMAWLCAINLGLMTFGVGAVRKDGDTPGSTRALCLFLGFITEFLVAASVAKMVLYIGTYGLTRLRVLTMVIMVFLSVTTAVVALWLYRPKIQYMKVVLVAALALGAGVLWLDVDTQVANYNVSAYRSGRLETMDVWYLCTLGPGAVDALAELTEDENCGPAAREALHNLWLEDADDFREMTVIGSNARKLQLELFPDAE